MFTQLLATPEGVDRAFKKLDTIKSEIVYWEAGAQAPQLLADGQVVMVSAWNGRLQKAIDKDKKPFKIVWDHQGLDWDWWAITKDTPKIEEAYRFIAFASALLPWLTRPTISPMVRPTRCDSKNIPDDAA